MSFFGLFFLKGCTVAQLVTLPTHSSRIRCLILSSGYSPCCVSVHVVPVSMWVYSRLSGFKPTLKNIPVGGLARINCPFWISMRICICMCVVGGCWCRVGVHRALRWTGVPSVYSHLTYSVAGTDSGSTLSLSRINWLLKVNEWERFMMTIGFNRCRYCINTSHFIHFWSEVDRLRSEITKGKWVILQCSQLQLLLKKFLKIIKKKVFSWTLDENLTSCC